MIDSDGILSMIGNTPLIRLRRLIPEARFRLFGKLEALNPAGSAKDRSARGMIERALEKGKINSDTVVVESSSGNMAIGLAQVCGYWGLRLICVVDPRTTPQHLQLIRAYGAEIDYVAEPDPETGDFLVARLKRVRQLCSEIDNSFWPNQYANPDNCGAHYETTICEVVEALNGELDYLFVAVSTFGTIRGCAEYLRDQGMATKVIAVDAEGSVLFCNERKRRMIPGLGAGRRPELFDPSLVEEYVLVSDVDCIVGCRRLVAREAILAGGSSGGVVMAVERLKDRIPADGTCVAIFHDRGDRYLDTVFSDDWVREHFGDLEQSGQG